MSGCDFENRSFKVPMSMPSANCCEECGQPIVGIVYKKNGRKLCKEHWDASFKKKEKGN